METQSSPADTSNLPRTTLAILFIGILIAACFWIVRPFLSSLIWAVMIVIATWPIFIGLEKWLWGKRWLAVMVMTLCLLLIVFVPILVALMTILGHADEVVAWFKTFSADTIKIPPPPAWLEKIPMAGHWIVEQWQKLAATSPAELAKLSKPVAPYAAKLVGWFVGHAGNLGLLLIHFLLTVAISAILYVHGETAARGVRAFARRLAGQQGEDVAVLSAKAVRGVALGIVVTAFVQSSLGGIGLFVAGIPGAMLLTAVMLLLCITQLGPGLVLLPSAIWLFWSGHTMAGFIFAVWAVLVCFLDNFLRPILIRKGADLPLLLILAGVIGGLIAFGIIGLFIGPVILAVTYTLLRSWVSENLKETSAKGATGGNNVASP